MEADAIFTIPASVDFRLQGTLEVSGTLFLAAGDHILSDAGGIRVSEDGILSLASAADSPLVLGQTQEEWPEATDPTVRLEVNGQIEGGHYP